MFKRLSHLVGLFFIILIAFVFQKPPDTRVKGASLRSTISVHANADTFIRSYSPDMNYGDYEWFSSLNTLIAFQDVPLIKFDLSALPNDAVVVDATLRLYLIRVDWCQSANLGVYFITSSWDESSITWNTSSALTTSPSGISTRIDDSIGAYKDIAISTGFVQTWLDDPTSNHGVMIRNLTQLDCGFIFQSREGGDHIPYLEITYSSGSDYEQLSGRVYHGAVGDESTPIEDVNLSLHCSTSSDVLGTQIDSTTTDPTGWYGLKGYDGCNYYTIVETDPGGYISTGATTVDGTILSADKIQYQAPLSGQIHTGNKFWDQLDPNGFDIFLPLIIK